jgi:hypothetical protein
MSNVVRQVVSEFIPCAFAKSQKDGSAGLHEVKLVVDYDMTTHVGVLKHISCECQNIYGTDMLLGFGNPEDSCYRVVSKFRDFLLSDKFKTEDSYYTDRRFDSLQFGVGYKYYGNVLLRMFNNTLKDAGLQHRKRCIDKAEEQPKSGFYPNLFNQKLSSIAQDAAMLRGIEVRFEPKINEFQLQFWYRPIAHRPLNGSWTVYAEHKGTNGELALSRDVSRSYFEANKDRGNKQTICNACNSLIEDKFWEKHCSSDSHKNIVNKKILAGLMATSPKGLAAYKKFGPERIRKSIKDNNRVFKNYKELLVGNHFTMIPSDRNLAKQDLLIALSSRWCMPTPFVEAFLKHHNINPLAEIP